MNSKHVKHALNPCCTHPIRAFSTEWYYGKGRPLWIVGLGGASFSGSGSSVDTEYHFSLGLGGAFFVGLEVPVDTHVAFLVGVGGGLSLGVDATVDTAYGI